MRVTVVIANRDYEDLVARAIQSVYEQKYDFITLAIVDDGSQDASWAAIQKATAKPKYPTETFHLEQSQGQSKARNLAIEALWDKTDLFAFLDSDDRFLKGAVKKLTTRFQGDVGLAYGDHYLHRSPTGRGVYVPKAPFSYQGLMQSDLIGGNYMVRRTALEKHGLFDETMVVAENHDLSLRIAGHAAVSHIPEPLIRVYQTGRGLRDTIPRSIWAAYTARALSNGKKRD